MTTMASHPPQLPSLKRFPINFDDIPDFAKSLAVFGTGDLVKTIEEVKNTGPSRPAGNRERGPAAFHTSSAMADQQRFESRAERHALNVVPILAKTRSLDKIHRTQDADTTVLPSTRKNRSASTQNGSRDPSESSSYETDATSLPPLQAGYLVDENLGLEPLNEEDIIPGSFDLVAPGEEFARQYALEARSELMFSTEHLKVIFADPSLLLRFTVFLNNHRQSSIPVLVYYLDTIKALKAISYANAIAHSLDPIDGLNFTNDAPKVTINTALEEKAQQAFDIMVRDDLPAYITHIYVQTVSLSITRRIVGTLPVHLREASEGLAEVFCLTDPSRPDNPIVFASEEFHRTTQYGMSYVIGRNCRFLQGPKTNPFSVRRFKEKVAAGVEHCEVFLNYRRDGSPFMNLLMCAPLCDSRGQVRYFIGAQVDVSGLVKECSDLESLNRLIAAEEKSETNGVHNGTNGTNGTNGSVSNGHGHVNGHEYSYRKDQFQELAEMLNMQELDTVRKWGGWMHREQQEEVPNSNGNANVVNWNKPRVLIHDRSPEGSKNVDALGQVSGKLSGVYENYLLVRPYPSLRILFASPSLRIPGLLQSPFMSKIGGSTRVREELTQALADGRGVTAKVRWVTRLDSEGRNRWIHCTPLIGSNGAIGVWMVVIVDDENDQGLRVRYRQAPPVDPRFRRQMPTDDTMSLTDLGIRDGRDNNSIRESIKKTAAEGWNGDRSDGGSLNTLQL